MTVDEVRSRTMRAVRSVDTKPEMLVRRLIHSMGYRFRIHRKDLPGSPDLVFPGKRKVIFVHGCFWHGHDCKRGARKPKANADYWSAKIARNSARDVRVTNDLSAQDWKILTIWECELSAMETLKYRIVSFLE